MRQLREEEISPPLRPIAETSPALRARLEAVGIVFRQDDDSGAPGPNRWAAVELNNGTQFAFQHFYDQHFLAVSAQPGGMSPAERFQELLDAIGPGSLEILTVFERW